MKLPAKIFRYSFEVIFDAKLTEKPNNNSEPIHSDFKTCWTVPAIYTDETPDIKTNKLPYNFHNVDLSNTTDSRSKIISWSIYSTEDRGIGNTELKPIQPTQLFIYHRQKIICQHNCNQKYQITDWKIEHFNTSSYPNLFHHNNKNFNLNYAENSDALYGHFYSERTLDILQNLEIGAEYQIKFSFDNFTFGEILPGIDEFDFFDQEPLIANYLTKVEIAIISTSTLFIFTILIFYICHLRIKQNLTKKGFLQQLRHIGLPEECNILRNINHKDFKLQAKLGDGHFGEVYKATLYDKRKKFSVAVKCLKKDENNGLLGKKLKPTAASSNQKASESSNTSSEPTSSVTTGVNSSGSSGAKNRKTSNYPKPQKSKKFRKKSNTDSNNLNFAISNKIFNDTAQEALLHHFATKTGHPNIVCFYGISIKLETNMTTFYILNEFCSGQNLQKYLLNQAKLVRINVFQNQQKHQLKSHTNTYKFDEALFFNIASQIAKAGQHLSAIKILHRDIACRNILLLHPPLNEKCNTVFQDDNLSGSEKLTGKRASRKIKHALNNQVNNANHKPSLKIDTQSNLDVETIKSDRKMVKMINDRANFIRSFKVKLTDFGLARKMNLPMSNPVRFYTSPVDQAPIPVYLFPPELEDCLFDQKRGWTEKIEVWSFGVLCWQIASCGAHPVTNSNGRLTLSHYGTNKMHKIMQKCWKVEEKDRASFRELAIECSKMFAHLMHQFDLAVGKPAKDRYKIEKFKDLAVAEQNSKTDPVPPSAQEPNKLPDSVRNFLPETVGLALERHLSNLSDRLNPTSYSYYNDVFNKSNSEDEVFSQEVPSKQPVNKKVSIIDKGERKIVSSKSDYYYSFAMDKREEILNFDTAHFYETAANEILEEEDEIDLDEKFVFSEGNSDFSDTFSGDEKDREVIESAYSQKLTPNSPNAPKLKVTTCNTPSNPTLIPTPPQLLTTPTYFNIRNTQNYSESGNYANNQQNFKSQTTSDNSFQENLPTSKNSRFDSGFSSNLVASTPTYFDKKDENHVIYTAVVEK